MSRHRHDHRATGPYPRTARLNEVLREVVAESLERMTDTDERLRMMTVTSVETSPDLRHATVYLSSLPEGILDALALHRAELQRAIARQVRLKRTPLLEFAPDPAVAHGARVDDILRRIRARQGAADHGDTAP